MDEESKKFKPEDLKDKVEELIDCIVKEEELKTSDVDLLGKLVDIHKDLSNEEYWKIKEEVYDMRYSDYEDYGRRGRYGRRGVPGTGRGRYRGGDYMDEMMEYYETYNEASKDMYRGDYSAEGEMVKSVEGIMKNVCEIVEELAEADSPEVMRIIKRYAKKINEMD